MTLKAFLGYPRDVLEDIANNTSDYYVTYKIKKKSGGYRVIEAPQNVLKEIQRTILRKVLSNFMPHPIAHGFKIARSPKTNAVAHLGAKCMLIMDLADFFPSVSSRAVAAWFFYMWDRRKPPVTDITRGELVSLLTRLCTLNMRLPQGAPTSPMLANLVCLKMDKSLSVFAKRENLAVTRYADDITISSKEYRKMHPYIDDVGALVAHHGFKVNKKKTRILSKGQRLSTTGVVINVHPNAPRRKRRNLRAELHNLKGQTISHMKYLALKGKVEWAKHLNPQQGQRLLTQLSLINVS